jgi:rare lipoprotein A
VRGSRARPDGRIAALGATLAAVAVVSGCSTYRPETAQAPGQTRSVVAPERSARGNPPFYEVFGERYHVLETSDGYREHGIASWYGPDFHGKPTSSGETYDMHAMTAAHKTLPIPTWVEVTNLRNDRRVIVRVNDRGPFVDDRVIDLSYSAAEALDMIRDGTARVQVRALGSPAASPVEARATEPRSGGLAIISEASAGTPVSAVRPSLYVQVGAFSDRDNAAGLVARLRRSGFDNTIMTSQADGGRTLHRVRIGPLADAEQFDRIRYDLRAIGLGDSRLVVDN